MRRSICFGVVALLALLGVARPADAPLGFTVYGTGEFDTDDAVLVLGGVNVAPRRTGWSPMAGVEAWWLQFEAAPDDTRNITAITPSVGLQHMSATSLKLVRVGYSFQDTDVLANTGVFADVGGDGVVVGGQLEYWGTGALSAQALATHNFGSETFWARGRVLFRVFNIGDTAFRVGPEAAYINSNDFDAAAIGGALGFNPGRGVALTARVGRKIAPLENRETQADDATYFGFEIALFPH